MNRIRTEKRTHSDSTEIPAHTLSTPWANFRLTNVKDVPGGFPKSDLLGVTVALIHVVLCQLQRQLALWL